MEVQVTRSEIQQLASKLDEFGEVLTEKERAVLLYAFNLLKKDLRGKDGGGQSGGGSKLPPLSAAFNSAFTPGGAAGFGSDAERTNVTGTVGITISF